MKATIKTSNPRNISRTGTVNARENGLNGDDNKRSWTETEPKGFGNKTYI